MVITHISDDNHYIVGNTVTKHRNDNYSSEMKAKNKIKNNTRQKFTTMAVSHNIHDRILELGKKGESYNDVLERMLDTLKGKNKLVEEPTKVAIGGVIDV